jgi:NAD(P)-dependent dehydrogenase (short-subunit alcohol dehydrogenase family)
LICSAKYRPRRFLCSTAASYVTGHILAVDGELLER